MESVNFERALRTQITNLYFVGCKNLLMNDGAEHCNVLLPIFICICHEKAIWKTIASKLGIDLEAKWGEYELRELIERREKQLDANYIKNTGIANDLVKVAVDNIFDRFVMLFVAYGYDVDVTDFSGHTALHYAIRYGFYSTAEVLIKSGADLSKPATIASWIQVKLPALYHSLYSLDEKMTKILLTHSKGKWMEMDLEKIDDFVYLPKKTPETIKRCLQNLTELNPINFLLIVLIIKSYGNPNIDSQSLVEMINVGKSLSGLLIDFQSHLVMPKPLHHFYITALASMKNSQLGVCKDKFFFQLIDSLFNINHGICV